MDNEHFRPEPTVDGRASSDNDGASAYDIPHFLARYEKAISAAAHERDRVQVRQRYGEIALGMLETMALRRGAETSPQLPALVPQIPSIHRPIYDLVDSVADAIRAKLIRSEAKHHWCNAWQRSDWQDDLVEQMHAKIAEGDALDVAIYAVFAWHHGWRLTPHPDTARHQRLRELAIVDAVTGDTVTIHLPGAIPVSNFAQLDAVLDGLHGAGVDA
ncbi:MAG: hypothetical protein EPN79_16175 [Burkholderiaceae bacterium]|nr:MAG: hypothetical protein EPN79_16175 [Burkholderiaceae bacterium]